MDIKRTIFLFFALVAGCESSEQRLSRHLKTCPICDYKYDRSYGWTYVEGCKEFNKLLKEHNRGGW